MALAKSRNPQGAVNQYAPPAFELADAHAVQAWAAGTAGEGQQKRAYEWILHHACKIKEDPFLVSQPDATAYLLGRQSVARAIVTLLNVREKPND